MPGCDRWIGPNDPGIESPTVNRENRSDLQVIQQYQAANRCNAGIFFLAELGIEFLTPKYAC